MLPVFYGLSLIRSRFSPAQAQLQLGPAAFEVDVQGNQSITILLDVSGEGLDLAFVNQELSGASGLVIARAGLGVRGNVDADGENPDKSLCHLPFESP